MAGPPASSPAALLRMQRQPRRDTRAERVLRSEVHRLGLRYRVDRPVLAGVRRRADITFGPARVAVFVDGCFWHMCPKHRTFPKENAVWWQDKLEANVRRDRDTDQRLREVGWVTVRVWEHEDMTEAARTIAATVLKRRGRKNTPDQHSGS